MAVQILRNSEEAEDLVQDVFLYIFNKCDAFQSSKSTARSWIVQITYHRAIDRRRYLATRRFYDQVDVDGPGLDIPSERPEALYDQSIEAVLGSEEAKRIFDSLSADQQETLRLFFFEGYTFEEIAKRLDQNLGNVRNHYYRGLEKIRERVFPKKQRR